MERRAPSPARTKPASAPCALAFIIVAAFACCGDGAELGGQPCPDGLVRGVDGRCGIEGAGGACDGSGVVINEIFYDPIGTEDEADFVFVEIGGRPGGSLEGLSLVLIDGATGNRYLEQPLAGRFASDGLFVIGGGGVIAADLTLDDTPEKGPDAVQIIDCEGAVIDAVAYGLFGAGDTFAGEGTPAPAASEGTAIARCLAAADSDDNAADFGMASPTPGEPNLASSFVVAGRCGGEIGCLPGALSSLRINEVLYNPEGTDGGNEFVELRGDPGLVLDGAQLVGINGDGGRELFPALTLAGVTAADGLFVIGGAGVPGLDLPLPSTLQNGPDSLRLIDCDQQTILDAIGYGSFDADQSFGGEGAAAPGVGEGESLARCAGGIDTDDNAADFGPATPTPGAANDEASFVEPGFCGGGAGCTVGLLAGARIEEVLYDPDGPDAGKEFIELRGEPGATLAGATIVALNGSDGQPYADRIRLHGVLDSEGLFLIGGAEVPMTDQTMTASLQNGPDSLVLYDCDGETPLDALGYGEFDPSELNLGEGAPAPATRGGTSLSRCPTADDTGDNATDFSATMPSPGSRNSGFTDPLFCDSIPVDCTVGAASEVRINEVFANPAGPDGAVAEEFIELRGPAGLSLDGLIVAGVNGSNGEEYMARFMLTGEIGSDGLFVIGEPGVPGADFESPSQMQNGPDSLVLYDCDGLTVLDALGYGSFGQSHVFAGEGEPAPAGEGLSMSRCEGASDTDDNRSDFGLASPSPGAPNTDFDDESFCSGAEPCEPPPIGTVRINEVLYDGPGSDGAGEAEFVELAGLPGQDLSALRLSGVNGSNGAIYFGPTSLVGVLDGDGLYVAGGSDVASAAMALPRALQNGPDSIVLADCEGTVFDALAYGVFDADEISAGEGRPAPAATNGSSVGRDASSRDSDDNASDFSVYETPTPGQANR